MTFQSDPRGSVWRRWDPHIHTPETVLEDQFGPDAWDEYLRRIEEAAPMVEVLGITDYASLDRYEEVLTYKAAGRLPDVAMIFPNVELRLPLITKAGHPLNIHLLFSPEDPDHVDKARSFLRRLKFDYQGEPYECSREDLIRLGRKHDPDAIEDHKALEIGTNQFKVYPTALKEALKASRWAQDNVIIAVAGSSNDGSSGLRAEDSSLEATRVEIEAMSDAIFSSQPAQREFWLGKGAATEAQLEKKWNGKKACIHGSDAHRQEKVAKPDNDRYTWIKGDPTFESLRQACLEPEERAIVSDAAPSGPLEYQTIDSVSVGSASWLTTPDVPLNRGLVAIIGARGSGKTALADLVALGASAATPERMSGPSFLKRAREFLTGSSVTLTWADGRSETTPLAATSEAGSLPEVQYLSQQFVENLCSSEGMTDELLVEIERVVFQAHPSEERLGARTFQELLALKAEPGRAKRARAIEANQDLAERIDRERELLAGLDMLRKQKVTQESSINADKAARQKLIVRGGEERSKRLEEVDNARAAVQIKVDTVKRRLTALSALADAARDLESQRLPALKAALERDHAEAGLTQEQWNSFEIGFKADPQPAIARLIAGLQKQLTSLLGPEIPKPEGAPETLAPFIAEGADLTSATFRALQAESWRLSQLIGLDTQKASQLIALNAKITAAEGELQKLTERIAAAEGAAERIRTLVAERRANYVSLFDGFDDEQRELNQLYAPLKKILASNGGTLGKLSFTVRRVVNAEVWALQGEELLDLRKTGTFQGRGELLRVVGDELLEAWTTGTSDKVATAMAKFREAHDKEFAAQAKLGQGDQAVERRNWLNRASAWLNSTDHITLQYGVQYDGVDIEQLSPGTRGIVLLLLYLSLDETDARPLIIDQPEENLDPKSIFDELVGRFRTTRHRRQIIIVTHNANLVVNTDADQVIVANARPHRVRQLPKIKYLSGGLENPEIRAEVCDILEGGKKAFEERAKRLRFRLT